MNVEVRAMQQRVVELERFMEELKAERRDRDLSDARESDFVVAAAADWVDERDGRQRNRNGHSYGAMVWAFAGLIGTVLTSLFVVHMASVRHQTQWASCAASVTGMKLSDAHNISAAEAFARPGLHEAEQQLASKRSSGYALLTATDGRAFLCATPNGTGSCACASASNLHEQSDFE